jgi:hypothetical protein
MPKSRAACVSSSRAPPGRRSGARDPRVSSRLVCDTRHDRGHRDPGRQGRGPCRVSAPPLRLEAATGRGTLVLRCGGCRTGPAAPNAKLRPPRCTKFVCAQSDDLAQDVVERNAASACLLLERGEVVNVGGQGGAPGHASDVCIRCTRRQRPGLVLVCAEMTTHFCDGLHRDPAHGARTTKVRLPTMRPYRCFANGPNPGQTKTR